MEQEFFICEESGVRIDKYLSTVTELSRARIQQLCDQGQVLVMEKPVKSSYKLKEGEEIRAMIPEDEELEVQAEDIPLEVLYEDHDVIVVNKPKGMIVHPAPGITHGTLVNALLAHCQDLSGINGVMRPGIVHRIDKDTTGCLIVCKNDLAHRAIAKQLEDKTCHRMYYALVEGVIMEEDGIVDAPIGRDPRDRQKMCVTDVHAKDARTHFHVVERFAHYTLIQCKLETGRTHQIRVHMKFINHPVVGDLKYGRIFKPVDTQGQALHAYELTFVHPRTQEQMTIQAPLPAYFEETLQWLRSNDCA